MMRDLLMIKTDGARVYVCTPDGVQVSSAEILPDIDGDAVALIEATRTALAAVPVQVGLEIDYRWASKSTAEHPV